MYFRVQQDRTQGNTQPGKKSGYYFNYGMSQKANFSRKKWDGSLKHKESRGKSRFYKNPLFLRPLLKQSSMLCFLHGEKDLGVVSIFVQCNIFPKFIYLTSAV